MSGEKTVEFRDGVTGIVKNVNRVRDLICLFGDPIVKWLRSDSTFNFSQCHLIYPYYAYQPVRVVLVFTLLWDKGNRCKMVSGNELERFSRRHNY